MLVSDDDLELHLGKDVDQVLGAAIHLGVALLPSESLHLADREALHADARQALLHLVQLEGLDDRLDFFHGHCLQLEFRDAGLPHYSNESLIVNRSSTASFSVDPPQCRCAAAPLSGSYACAAAPSTYAVSLCCDRSRPANSASSSTRMPPVTRPAMPRHTRVPTIASP